MADRPHGVRAVRPLVAFEPPSSTASARRLEQALQRGGPFLKPLDGSFAGD